MINNVTILDLETTGLDPEKDEVIEIGAILYSVKHQTVLQQASTLFPVKENPQEHINKISVCASNVSESVDLIRNEVSSLFSGMFSWSNYLIAHNAAFDKQWRTGIHEIDFWFQENPWLCTLNDFIWPRNSKPSNLITTALNHGIGVTKAHRALSDCQLIAELFDRTEDLQGLFEREIARSNEPRYLVIAQVDYDSRQLAKDFNFYWEFYKDTPKKVWQKELRESDLNIESSQWQFKFTTEIKND
jgi:DNA polymerase III subunit epsilon